MTQVTPFRVIGNLYFVGCKEASSHLIDTGDGLILIDTGYKENADAVVKSIMELGFDVKDIKYILHSHGHYDHTDATAGLLKLAPQAKTYLSFRDCKYIKGFVPDFDIQDGTVVSLGNTEIHCLFTPGHTEGSVSFFFDVTEEGRTYRAAMFGGAGVNQLKKAFMHRMDVPYRCRGLFEESIERLLNERVDVMVGNHTWHNHTLEKYEKMATSKQNPFVDPAEWERFLTGQRELLKQVLAKDRCENFVAYAHRGASEYCPENTMMSFYMGLQMGANGIETDVRRTRDGELVLFHDNTLERVVGVAGGVADYTYEELQTMLVKKGELYDKIPTLKHFLEHFSDRDITFAIELKAEGIEKDVSDLIRQYGIEKKTVVTSFNMEYLKTVKEYAPCIRVGYLTRRTDDAVIEELLTLGADEFCPHADGVTPETVAQWHCIGLNVRAWGIANEDVMKRVYDAGVDGMTANFPDRLVAYRALKNEVGE